MKIELRGNGQNVWDIAFFDVETKKYIPVRIDQYTIKSSKKGFIAEVGIVLGVSNDDRAINFEFDDKLQLRDVETGEILPTIGETKKIESDHKHVVATVTIEIFRIASNEHTGSIVSESHK